MMKKLLFTFFVMSFTVLMPALMLADTTTAKRPVTLRTKTHQSQRPHAPARIPLFCELDGNQIVITSEYPTLIAAEVTANDGFDVVGFYCATEPANTHTFSIAPQNTTLTIEIEVDGKTYTGEFFY